MFIVKKVRNRRRSQEPTTGCRRSNSSWSGE